MMPENEVKQSPKWSNTTKTVVVLVLAAIVLLMIARFKYLIVPVLIAVLISYLFHPLATLVTKRLHFPWKLSVTMIYVVFVLILIALLTWGGISIANELQNLIGFLNNLVTNLPTMVTNFLSKPLMIGQYKIDLPNLNLTGLWTWLQSMVQPAITKAANLIGTIASGAATLITWIGFTILISYFISAETDTNGIRLLQVTVPIYQDDLNRMGRQMSRIWNSFLRGQLIIMTVTIVWYTIMLGGVGVNFFFGLALLAGLARFVPYVGPFVAWVTYFLVGIFQPHNLFNLQPFWFGVLLVSLGLVSDFVMDNFVSPRVMSHALKIHPAAVLVTVLVAANLFGVIGMLLAAPVLASVKLLLTYIARKLLDQDPWASLQTYPEPQPLRDEVKERLSGVKLAVVSVLNWLKTLYDVIKSSSIFRKTNKYSPDKGEEVDERNK